MSKIHHPKEIDVSDPARNNIRLLLEELQLAIKVGWDLPYTTVDPLLDVLIDTCLQVKSILEDEQLNFERENMAVKEVGYADELGNSKMIKFCDYKPARGINKAYPEVSCIFGTFARFVAKLREGLYHIARNIETYSHYEEVLLRKSSQILAKAREPLQHGKKQYWGIPWSMTRIEANRIKRLGLLTSWKTQEPGLISILGQVDALQGHVVDNEVKLSIEAARISRSSMSSQAHNPRRTKPKIERKEVIPQHNSTPVFSASCPKTKPKITPKRSLVRSGDNLW